MQGVFTVGSESTVDVTRWPDAESHALRMTFAGARIALVAEDSEDGVLKLAAFLRSVAENALLLSASLDPEGMRVGRHSLRPPMTGASLSEWLGDTDALGETGPGRLT